MLLTELTPETSYEAPSTSNIFSNRQEESIPGTSNDTPSASNEWSSHQMRRIRNSFEESLQDQPQSKIIKMMSKIVTDGIGGENLNRSSAKGLKFIISECLKSPTQPKKYATSIKAKAEPKPYTPDEALSFVIDRKLTVED
ncbi:unnamed protein product [Parnassius apollo]|uniref:(apollo) hypothetical protein n=1 Tax=Parnassius apollo TaxID=110799 RepID=A0A8S3WCV6_PARAO|nr:unnamed protein product [Parnassius apollo]